MPRTTDCPNCRCVLSAPTEPRGRWLRCPRCSARFRDEMGVEAGAIDSDLERLAVGRAVRGRPLADPDRLLRMPAPPRPPEAPGDARRRARRCGSCDGHVPVGMSICPICGFDQESRRLVAGRIGVVELEPERLPPTPAGVLVLGWFSILASIGLGTALAVRTDAFGWVLAPPLAVVAWLGLYGGIQLLRGFRVRPLAAALALAAALDIGFSFIAPLLVRGAAGQDQATVARMVLGAGGLLLICLAACYLGTEPVRRFFASRRPLYAAPMDEEEWLGGYTTTI